ncbi:MAG: hypothetical protein AAB874_03095 [Patescibacteria group bacterium]
MKIASQIFGTELKLRLQAFINESAVLWCLRINAFTTLVTGAVMIWSWQRLPPLVPLFYSLPWGEEQLAPPYFLTLLLLIQVFNVFVIMGLASLLYRSYRYLSFLLIFGVTFITLLIQATLIQIILLMT